MDTQKTVFEICRKAKDASRSFSVLSTAKKNLLLSDIALALKENKDKIIDANMLDLSRARDNGIPDHMLDRLMLNESRIDGICASLHALM